MWKAAASTGYSLYVHVPFCHSFCDYCDFYSVLAAPAGEGRALVNRYLDTLAGDARLVLGELPPSSVPSVYIGGGTPSVLGAEGIARLLGALGDLLPSPDGEGREWTVEANPESLDAEFLYACREGGVNRLSLGVQSFSPLLRERLHRRGGPGQISRGLALGAEIFPQSFSADLLTGLPGQDRAAVLGDIERLAGYKPAHVSLYALTLEEGTPLWDRAPELPPQDQADRLWIEGRDALEQAGYRQYEVSNFSLPGKESRHNLRYWGMRNWMALGPSGSGTLIDEGKGAGLRLTWPADLDAWLNRDGDWRGLLQLENLDPLTLMKESLLMGFRCLRWPGPSLFTRRFGLSPQEAIPKTLAKWRERGLVAAEGPPDSGAPGGEGGGPGPALSREGLLFLNPFLMDAFDELASVHEAGYCAGALRGRYGGRAPVVGVGQDLPRP